MTHITSTMALTKRHATATNSNSNVSSTSNGTTTAQSTTIDPTCVRQAAWKRQQAKQQNKKQKQKSNYYYYSNNNNTAIGRFLRLVRQGYGGIHPLTIQGSIILLLAILKILSKKLTVFKFQFQILQKSNKISTVFKIS